LSTALFKAQLITKMYYLQNRSHRIICLSNKMIKLRKVSNFNNINYKIYLETVTNKMMSHSRIRMNYPVTEAVNLSMK